MHSQLNREYTLVSNSVFVYVVNTPCHMTTLIIPNPIYIKILFPLNCGFFNPVVSKNFTSARTALFLRLQLYAEILTVSIHRVHFIAESLRASLLSQVHTYIHIPHQ